jgi:hypothetical protein
VGTVLPFVQRRVVAVARRCSPLVLIWVASIVLGVADVVYAGLLPGPVSVLDSTALALASLAGAVFLLAAGLGLRSWRQARAAGVAGNDVIAREAQWGIAQIEAWLARQDHSRDG